jgi:polyhydroxybutyrate depolymerase
MPNRLAILAIAAAGFYPFAMPQVQAAVPGCGAEMACQVEGGDYRIELPKAGKPRGVYVFFHGYEGSALLQMTQHHDLVEVAESHGLAFVAVDGLNGTWSHPNAAAHDRDEQAFIGRVLDDLSSRFGFRADNMVLGGFSQGASMAWYTACQQGQRAAAMVTFSGVFWNPLPAPSDCVASIPKIVHFHGTADQTFPLAGRAIGGRFHQGDTFKSASILRQRASCDIGQAKKITLDGIACDDVPNCIRGDSILCIHSGGHEAKPDMLDAGLTEIGF